MHEVWEDLLSLHCCSPAVLLLLFLGTLLTCWQLLTQQSVSRVTWLHITWLQVIAPSVRAFLYTWGGRKTAEGEKIPVRIEELDIGYIDGMLLLPLVVEHSIDERSPLYGHTFESLRVWPTPFFHALYGMILISIQAPLHHLRGTVSVGPGFAVFSACKHQRGMMLQSVMCQLSQSFATATCGPDIALPQPHVVLTLP